MVIWKHSAMFLSRSLEILISNILCAVMEQEWLAGFITRKSSAASADTAPKGNFMEGQKVFCKDCKFQEKIYKYQCLNGYYQRFYALICKANSYVETDQSVFCID